MSPDNLNLSGKEHLLLQGMTCFADLQRICLKDKLSVFLRRILQQNQLEDGRLGLFLRRRSFSRAIARLLRADLHDRLGAASAHGSSCEPICEISWTFFDDGERSGAVINNLERFLAVQEITK